MTKPFLPMELILRMSAILRRTRRLEEPERSTFCLGETEIDLDAGGNTPVRRVGKAYFSHQQGNTSS